MAIKQVELTGLETVGPWRERGLEIIRVKSDPLSSSQSSQLLLVVVVEPLLISIAMVFSLWGTDAASEEEQPARCLIPRASSLAVSSTEWSGSPSRPLPLKFAPDQLIQLLTI